MDTDTAMRSDGDAPLALARDCTGSVRNGGVRRSEEILADDSLCSDPGGPLVDRQPSRREPRDR